MRRELAGQCWLLSVAKFLVDLMNDRSAMETIRVMADDQPPYLDEFGERLRTLRSRRGATRKELALASGISERYLAKLEGGRANPSLLILDQLAHGLDCAIAELLGDVTTSTPEWLLLRDPLNGRSEVEMHAARMSISQTLALARAAWATSIESP